MKKIIRAVAASAVAVASITAMAANDGLVGATSSTGDLNISLDISQLIRVAGLDDMVLTQQGSVYSAEDPICVGQTGGITGFTIVFDGGNYGPASERFNLSNGSELIPYTVQFTQDLGAAAGDQANVTSGVAGATYNTLFAGTDCDPTFDDTNANSKIIVTVDETDVQTVAADTYTDTLVVTVTAN
ncbi:hypothetical protein [Biformimicrobium ophioploci]|nr:hypothetical protein [Microbulbifer sp. NKW57]